MAELETGRAMHEQARQPVGGREACDAIGQVRGRRGYRQAPPRGGVALYDVIESYKECNN